MKQPLQSHLKKLILEFPLIQPYTTVPFSMFEAGNIPEGEGIHVYDENGKCYIDAAGGLWNVSCGLGNKTIIDAIVNQLNKLAYAPLFCGKHPPAVRLAGRLNKILPSPLKKIFYTCSGSESIAVAVKIVRGYFSLNSNRKKNMIVCLKNCYHGMYYSRSGTESDIDEGLHHFQPDIPGFIHINPPYCYRCPYGEKHPSCGLVCAVELEQVLKKNKGRIAAFMMEPIMGSAGIIIPPAGYLKRVKQICGQNGIFMIFDEVATGFGRTGEMFAAQLFNISPDIMALSKGMNSGYLPLGATVFSDETILPYLEHNIAFPLGTTQGGNPVCCASCLATIDYIEEKNLLENCRIMGEILLHGCLELQNKCRHIGDVRGRGLMIGIELVLDKKDKMPVENRHIHAVCSLLRENGLIVYPSPVGFSMFPALTITEVEIRQVLEKLALLVNIKF
ncbi:MAG: aspartate aminotransferase family protein [Spirochaetales bacterium]|nr:aspartate aminotransferase family protein [Spirochaetales bacterium]